MAIKSKPGQGREKLGAGSDSDGSSAVDTGLPILLPDAQGSERSAIVRPDSGESGFDTSLRDAVGRSSARSGGQDSFTAVFGNRRGLCAGSVGDGRNSGRIEESRVQNSRPAQPAQLADVSDRYFEPIEETTAETSGDGLCHGDAVLEAENNYQYLAKLRVKALRVLGETLDVPTPDEDDDDYARVLSIKKDAAINVVTASLKADENCFRQRRNDALDRLYAAVEGALATASAPALTIENMAS